MEIKVNEQTQKFHLATTEGYVHGIGHGIQVGKYKFCAIPIGKNINISEVTTGVKVINVPITIDIFTQTSTKEDAMKFMVKVGEMVERIISKAENIDILIEDAKKSIVESFGEIPQPEDVDTDWIFADISDVKH
ncbi:TPA: hypothetical protein QCO88_001676 [Bacillus cereus]|uniref:Uncharacterized protein n=1 Tax=Bacillus thuringiensis TaxID=1428 RepID=A0A9X7B1X1_BACTU|nr:hypothetical protein [Bacillus thuringiensis]PFT96572.1 hypothetical protein COK81_08270 [Bacillus thuringiensis]HDR3899171.1 hypothetical protein [Bacillus cereus]